MNMMVEKAYELAKRAHAGQVDKAGVEYIKHIEAVVSGVSTPEERMVAYLHDVVEDTEVTFSDLKQHGFPASIIEAVELLTKADGMEYDHYLSKIKGNELARVVKLADLHHNSDLSRLAIVTEADAERVKKYKKAIEYLQ